MFSSILIFFCVISGANAQTTQENLNNFLQEFADNPAHASEMLPAKFNSKGQRHYPRAKFSEEDIRTREFIRLKDSERQKLCTYSLPGQPCYRSQRHWIGMDENNQVTGFFHNYPIEQSLEALSQSHFMKAKIDFAPWSGDFWPSYRMGVAARYADPQYPQSTQRQDYIDYFNENGTIDFQNKELLRILSPAEKYDILVGDSDFTMTKWALAESESAYTNGTAETWFGICHGWAPASFMMPRPQKAIMVEALKAGTAIRFYPHDIKALSSLLWANATLQSNFLGGRCNEKNPPKDGSGRIISSNCFDINPAAWHMTILNQVGKRSKSFVMDATYDHEVWNQPVTAYKVTYFNPQTKQISNSLSDSLIYKNAYIKDPFKAYRDPRTQTIVGISMEVKYLQETAAHQTETDGPYQDYIVSTQYIYDLEIDEAGNLIGGEWYQNAHPDFLWSPYDNARAISVVERELRGEWETGAPPGQWTSRAQFASRYGQPLAKVVERLIQLAQ